MKFDQNPDSDMKQINLNQCFESVFTLLNPDPDPDILAETRSGLLLNPDPDPPIQTILYDKIKVHLQLEHFFLSWDNFVLPESGSGFKIQIR
jgi:hypothetical protein